MNKKDRKIAEKKMMDLCSKIIEEDRELFEELAKH